MPFIPHTSAEVEAMLSAIGVREIAQLFDEIPSALLTADLSSVPAQLNEMSLMRLMQQRAPQYVPGNCFIGAGAYEHYIPAAVWQLVGRGEFYTAYTPYQAEASQGTLQLIYEYQSMMASLMGMEISNASMYDGASALAEAALMAARLARAKTPCILVPKTVHGLYREVLNTILSQQKIEIIEIDFDVAKGVITTAQLDKQAPNEFSALIIPQPNFFGCLEEVDALTNWAHAKNALAIGVVNPTAMALLKPPGEWGERGADIACGDGQPLGVPLSGGGPYFGFLTTRREFIRQIPGRIVGRTIDKSGKTGYTLTLQAREQHIRRDKATSNICTNQGLLVTAATIYLSLVGDVGLREVAMASHAQTVELIQQLKALGVTPLFSQPYFHECVVRLPKDIDSVLNHFAAHGVQAGLNLGKFYPELKNTLLICVTETKTAADLQRYAQLMQQALGA